LVVAQQFGLNKESGRAAAGDVPMLLLLLLPLSQIARRPRILNILPRGMEKFFV
jgi:hypothetical protein